MASVLLFPPCNTSCDESSARNASGEAFEPATPPRRFLRRRGTNEEAEKLANLHASTVEAACSRLAKRCRGEETANSVIPPQLRPYPLIGREQECALLDRFLKQSLGYKQCGRKGGAIYVSGGPGTGKTSSVTAAVEDWRRTEPNTQLLYVNCMSLPQRSVHGLMRHLIEAAAAESRAAPSATHIPPTSSLQNMASAAIAQMSKLGSAVVLIVDEVDQLVKKAACKNSNAAGLEQLFALPMLPDAPAIAIIAIANAVDLLQGSALGNFCSSLLFEPYNVEQLRNILKARFAAAGSLGAAAESMLGRVGLELQIRQVAKRSGDCRHLVRLWESALGSAQTTADAIEVADAECQDTSPGVLPAQVPTKPLSDRKAAVVGQSSASTDPLEPVGKLPMEQQVLLCVLATGTSEAERLPNVCSRYKECMQRLRQPQLLDCRNTVGSALAALEQQGLLSLRTKRGRAGTESIIELAVSRKALSNRLAEVNSSLKQCLT